MAEKTGKNMMKEDEKKAEDKSKETPITTINFSVTDKSLFGGATPFSDIIVSNSRRVTEIEAGLPADPWLGPLVDQIITYDDIYGNVISYELREEEGFLWDATYRVPITIFIHNQDSLKYYKEKLSMYLFLADGEIT